MLQQTGRYNAPAPASVADGWTLERLTQPSRLHGANGLRTGTDGRIYVAQVAGSQVSALNPDTGEIETISAMGAGIEGPDDLVFDRLQETAFPAQSVGRSILGTPDTVRSFNPVRLRAYLSRNYKAPGMIVAAAGAIDHAAIVADVVTRPDAGVGFVER